MRLTDTSCSIAAALLLSVLTQGHLGAQPGVISSTPSSGTGFTQTFTLAYSDGGGYGSLTSLQVLFNSTLTGNNACYVGYNPAGNWIVLLNDAGTNWSSSAALGSGGTLQNSQCSVNATNSSASGSGNNFTLNLAFTFSSPFAGTKNIYMNASDNSGGTPWATEGTWTVGTPTIPSSVSVTPSSGTGLSQSFNLIYSDTGGYGNLAWTQVLINSTLNGFSACYVYYNVAGNWISLDGDNNNWSSSAALGSGGTLQNSQCSVNATNSSASGSGNNLTLNLAVTFLSSFAGAKNTYMIAADNNGLQSQWQMEGTWTVGGSGPPPPATVTTYYTYDALDHLIQVSMPRPNGTQTRTFNYNNTAYLQSATNPENGTVNYTYNANGTMATKTDAKGQKAAYTYDAYQRVTQVQRYPSPGTTEDICQQTNFYYDTNPFDGSFSQYSMSRPTAAQYGIPSNLLNTGGSCPTPYQFVEMYSYIQGGAVSRKRLTMTTAGTRLSSSLDTTQTYDNEGKMLTVKYPEGTTYTYSYDTQGRPTGLVDNQASPMTWVNNVQYGPAGELRQLSYGVATGMVNGAPQSSGMNTETRTYNSLYQMTNLTVAGVLNMTYQYSATQNNGQITQQTDGISGEQVSYAYDNLNRLIAAATADSSWGLSFSYDGFGNRTGSTVTKGTGPNGSWNVDPATNRVAGAGYNYDANGNQTTAPGGATLSYDVENRLVSTSTGESYAYNAAGIRVWKRMPSGTEELYFYGASGQKVGTYKPTVYTNPASFVIATVDTNVSFGGRTIVSRGVTVLRDRVGSNRVGGVKYYPYGEEEGAGTANDRDKYGTYYRDATTGLDYARNRYYASSMGRFMTPDPYKAASAGPADPGSWNKYAYTSGDPINRIDPSGQDYCDPDTPEPAECIDPTDSGPPTGVYTSTPYCGMVNYISTPQSDPGCWTTPIDTFQSLINSAGLRGVNIYSANNSGAGLGFADAGTLDIALGICAAQPELCVVLAGTAGIWVAATYLPNLITAISKAISQSQPFPTVNDLQTKCQPVGAPVIVPSTNIRNKGGSSIEQTYQCSDGKTYTVHTLVDANGNIIDQHVRPGSPKYGP